MIILPASLSIRSLNSSICYKHICTPSNNYNHPTAIPAMVWACECNSVSLWIPSLHNTFPNPHSLSLSQITHISHQPHRTSSRWWCALAPSARSCLSNLACLSKCFRLRRMYIKVPLQCAENAPSEWQVLLDCLACLGNIRCILNDCSISLAAVCWKESKCFPSEKMLT